MVLAVRKLEAPLLLLCLCLALSTPLAGDLDSSHLPTLSLTPTVGRVSIATGAEFMCDPQGDIPLKVAQRGSYARLEPEVPTSDKCHGYWVRFKVRASYLPPGGWILQLSRTWSFADLYLIEGENVTVERTGTELAPQLRTLASGDMAFPLPLENASEQIVYLHLVGDTSRFGDSRSIGAFIQTFETWTLRQRSLLFGQGVYAGIIVGLALYNLILFLTIRESVYFYYVIYVCSFGSFWIARTGFFFQYLWPQHPLWERQTQPLLAVLAIIFSTLFVRRFLATREHSRTVDLLLLATAALTLVWYLASLVSPRIPLSLPLALIGLVVTIFYAVIGLVTLLRGYRPARFFLVAWTALLAGNVLYIFMFLRLLPMTFVTYNAAQAGSALECILLAFALADRVNLLKHEKDEEQSQYTRELQNQVQQRTAELSNVVDKLQTASITDPLTGLSNRRHVEASIQPWIAELQRERVRNSFQIPSRHIAICLADLDHFKQINDDLGHAVGDKVLRAAADILKQNVRATAILSRWGGEEFLILDHVTGQYEDLLMAERLRQSIIEDTPPIILEAGRPLSLSLGVVRYPFSQSYPELLDWDHCLALADHALYRAKRAGRNRWQCYRPNENALCRAVQASGAEELRRLLRVHSDEAFALGLIEIVAQVPSDVEVP